MVLGFVQGQRHSGADRLMVSLASARDLREARSLPFCYFCGEGFAAGKKATRDHVPPKGVFAVEHRRPLILPAHSHCNKSHQGHDQHMAQVIGLRRENVPSNPQHRLLKVHLFERPGEGGRLAAIETIDIGAAVWGWVRGFHAALYREFLPRQNRRAVELPFPEVEQLENGEATAKPVREQRAVFVEIIKMNRAAGHVDQLISNAGTVRYECVWGEVVPGLWRCAFALDVYDWRDLGPPEMGQRGCVGIYEADHRPVGATQSTGRTDVTYSNDDPLDPFGN